MTIDQKRRESGVRAVLKGKHVVTAAEVYEGVAQAEEASRKRKAKKPQKKKVCSNLPMSEEDSDIENNVESLDREIADCIAVQF